MQLVRLLVFVAAGGVGRGEGEADGRVLISTGSWRRRVEPTSKVRCLPRSRGLREIERAERERRRLRGRVWLVVMAERRARRPRLL